MCEGLCVLMFGLCFFFFNDTATTEIYTLSLHDALPISRAACFERQAAGDRRGGAGIGVDQTKEIEFRVIGRSEEHTSELQSLTNLVCRLLLEKKKKKTQKKRTTVR